MPVNRELLRRLAGYGERYYHEHLGARVASRDSLLRDWRESLDFWFGRAFFQGRSDKLSEIMENRAMSALNAVLSRERQLDERALRELAAHGWLRRENWEDEQNPLGAELLREKVSKRYDRLLVLSTLDLMVEIEHLNIVRWAVERVREGHTVELYLRLNELASVGPKIASFFLRDLVDVFDLREFVRGDDRARLQPVDVWVERMAAAVGIPEEATPTGGPLAADIVSACDLAGVDPVRFNQGAWYVGFNATKVLLEVLGGAGTDGRA